MTPDDFPARHPELSDHVLIAWALGYTTIFACKGIGPMVLCEGPGAHQLTTDVDPFGLPILTPGLRQRLGDEWRKWKNAR